MSTDHPLAGPAALGIELAEDLRPSDDGWQVRDLVAPAGLDGPDGILQGGLAAGLALTGARSIDPFGAPVTGLAARLHAPTPLGVPLQLWARPTDQPATYEVELRDGDHRLVSATAELAGHEPSPRSLDLLELAEVDLPEPHRPAGFDRCVVCGSAPTHPHGQRILPGWSAEGTVVSPWVCDDDLGPTGVVDPLVVSAVLDCPTLWSAWHAITARGDAGGLLASYRLVCFRDAPIMEPLRTVARLDEVDGRKLHTRGALLDEDGGLYAISSALHVSVPEVPTLG
jgi:hypothetical protein